MSWSNTCDRIIVFFDIMGFKNLVYNSPHIDVLHKMEKLSRIVKVIDEHKFKDEDKELLVKATTFSDSIIIISENDTIASAKNIMLVSSFIMDFCFEESIPIKGCVAHGKLTADFDKSLFFGKPLIEAFLLHEELNMYSVILHHTFEAFFIDKKISGIRFSEDKRWIKYSTPLICGKSKHYHINWLWYTDHLEDKDKKIKTRNQDGINKLNDSIKRFKLTTSGLQRMYVDNTEDFINEAIDQLVGESETNKNG